MVVSRETAPHYPWGVGCEGWVLAPGPDLLVIEECMPAQTSEVRHMHAKARQFFFVLSGALTIERDAQLYKLGPMQGLEISPGIAHQVRNEGGDEARFLVISAPSTRSDRVDLD